MRYRVTFDNVDRIRFWRPALTSGLVMTAIMAIILFGGIRRLALVSEIIVPAMVLGYLMLALVVLALNMGQIPARSG